MPVSHEGFEYNHVLFKPLPGCVDEGCYADVFIPKGKEGPFPVAVSYHGGGFALGGPQHIFTGHVAYLQERGYAIVALEYRMAPHVKFDVIREDIADGYQWVLETLPTLENIDPKRVFVMGGSAGGASTLIATSEAKKRGIPLPRAIYSAYPLVDLTGPVAGRPKAITYEEALSTATEEQKATFAKLLAEPIATTHDIIADDLSNPSPRSAWALWVITLSALADFLGVQGDPGLESDVDKDWPPTVVFSAGADKLLDRHTNAEVLYNKLQAEGVESKLITCEGMAHGAIEPQENLTGHQWWDQCVEAIEFCLEHNK